MNRIRDLREDRDLKQSELAEAIGIGQRSLSNYETGKTNPDSEVILLLADYFGVSCDYLLGRTKAVGDTRIIGELERVEQMIQKIKKEFSNQ